MFTRHSIVGSRGTSPLPRRARKLERSWTTRSNCLMSSKYSARIKRVLVFRLFRGDHSHTQERTAKRVHPSKGSNTGVASVENMGTTKPHAQRKNRKTKRHSSILFSTKLCTLYLTHHEMVR